MKIVYSYEPDVCRFWIGATDGKNYQKVALQHWMEVDDVIEILKECQDRVRKL
jgi:hypothetical protein